MRTSIIGVTVVLAGSALILSACGGGDDDTPPAPAEEGDEPVVVEFWSNAWFPSSIEGRMELVERFNAEHEGEIEVEYIQGDWGQGETYVQSGAAAGGGIACVVEWHSSDGGAHSWYQKDWTIDLSPYLTDERRALTSEDQWEQRTFPDDGAIVSSATVLWEPMSILLYNPDHFQAAGIEPATAEDPWTWDQLFENAALLTLDEDGNHLGEPGFDPDNVVQWGYLPRLDTERVWESGLRFAQWAMGKPVIREENGTWSWILDEEGAAAYERFLTPVQEGIAPDLAVGLQGDTQEQALPDGLTSIIDGETFHLQIIGDNAPDFEVRGMPAPMNPGDTIFYQAGGEGMVITESCETPEEAAEFVFWTMEAENLAGYAHANGMLPANFDALEDEPFVSDPDWDIAREYLSRAETFSPTFNPHLVEFRDTVGTPTLMEVVEGKRSFAEANEILQEQAERMLNE